MAATPYTEKQFETDIESSLCTTGGYAKGNPETFNPGLALDNDTLLTFIQTTQPKEWKKYTGIYAGESEKMLLDR